MNHKKLLEKIAYNVIQGSVDVKYPGVNLRLKGQPGVLELMQTALDQNIDPKEIMVESLANPMEEVIKKYETEDYLAPNVLTSAECVGVAMEMLTPQLKEAGIKQAKFVIATVKGDFHECGAKFVTMMLKGFGYETINLGVDVCANRIADAVKNHKAAYAGLSAFYDPAKVEMEHVINKLEDEGIRDGVKVVVGGRAASAKFAENIGADAYCKNVFQIIDVLKSLDNWSGFAGAELN